MTDTVPTVAKATRTRRTAEQRIANLENQKADILRRDSIKADPFLKSLNLINTRLRNLAEAETTPQDARLALESCVETLEPFIQ